MFSKLYLDKLNKKMAHTIRVDLERYSMSDMLSLIHRIHSSTPMLKEDKVKNSVDISTGNKENKRHVSKSNMMEE